MLLKTLYLSFIVKKTLLEKEKMLVNQHFLLFQQCLQKMPLHAGHLNSSLCSKGSRKSPHSTNFSTALVLIIVCPENMKLTGVVEKKKH